jgi:CheY-like chemotaxis protein
MTPARPCRVLIVEDNADHAGALHGLLSAWGYEARIDYDGRRAIQMAKDFRPDVVLMDLALPILHGYSVARRLREALPGHSMQLVAITGSSADDKPKSEAAGFRDHLVKPVDPAHLKLVMRECAQGAH